MAKTPTTLSIDSDIKKQAQILLSELGLDLSTAVNMFLRQTIYENGIPFSLHRDRPNAVTLAALEEGERMLSDPNAKRFHSVEDLFADLEAE